MSDSQSPVLAKISSYCYHSPSYAASVVLKNGQYKKRSLGSPLLKKTTSTGGDKTSGDDDDRSRLSPPSTSSSFEEKQPEIVDLSVAAAEEESFVGWEQKGKSQKRRLAIISSDSSDEELTKPEKTLRKRVRISSESSQGNPESPHFIGNSNSLTSTKPGTSSNKSSAALKSRAVIDSDSDSDGEDSGKDLLAGTSAKHQLALLRKQRMTEEELEAKDSPADVEDNAEEEEDFVDSDQKHAPYIPNKLSKTELRDGCLKFFNEATPEELIRAPRCTYKMMEIITVMRPFDNYDIMVDDFEYTKGLSVSVIEEYMNRVEAKTNLERLLSDCSRRSLDLQEAVQAIRNSQTQKQIEQPKLLNPQFHLKPYQRIGLNWLALMHEQKMNAILADEMGLGKTIQVIAFLAHLRETERQSVHLIVVPSSTIDNWHFELRRWWPGVRVLNYYGTQEDRAHIRYELTKGKYRDKDMDILLTTYNMVQSKGEDRTFFRKFHINYVVYDEAHMLKNFTTKRYQSLLRIRCERKLMLTGTPLQNNLVELMSLMYFVMPELFRDFQDDIGQILGQFQQKNGMSSADYDQEKIAQAKKIMLPFVLRRLKKEVLSQLPGKNEQVVRCPLDERQRKVYDGIAKTYRDNSEELKGAKGARALMELRKAANHPLLLRRLYTDDKLRVMSKKLVKETQYRESDPIFVREDMEVMSDFELFRLCNDNKTISEYRIPEEFVCDSGKCVVLDRFLKDFKDKGEKVLLFSQFTMVLDILEIYLQVRGHSYLRLDGQTNVVDRQGLINDFNNDSDKFVFLLSTRAGGLGINLTSASVIILHDIDFNPYNDRQAEDRCHRVGQTKDVTVIKLIGENTVEESMLACAKRKLELETRLTRNCGQNTDEAAVDDTEDNNQTVESLLRQALCL